jgi:hypothetical protein
MCLTSNLTIDDGLELKLDKKMTSLGAAALPQHRLRSSIYIRLILFECSLACVPHLGVVDKARDYSCSNLAFGRSQDSLPTPTSFPVEVSRRRSPSRHAFSSPLDFLCKTSSFKCSFQLRHYWHSILLSCLLYRRSLATFTSLLQLRNCRRFADVQHSTAATRLSSKFCRDSYIFFSKSV